MTRIWIPGAIAMAAVVVASNVLVQFLLPGGLLTWGALSYPLAFLVTDVANRLKGPAAARRVVLAGFAVGALCSLVGSQIELESGPAVPLRIAVASGVAFLVAQLLDVAVFDRLREGNWWRAPLVSTAAGSVVDTALFFTLAFAAFVPFYGSAANEAISWAQAETPFLLVGPSAPLWVTLATTDWLAKIAVALAALVPFRLLVRHAPRAQSTPGRGRLA